MTKLRMEDVRPKNKKELLKQLEELKGELATLRVAQVTGGAASKLGKIKQTRKNIARVLTVINTKAMDAYRSEVKDEKNNSIPKALRPKKTRALRRALTPKERSKKTLKQIKKDTNFPARKFALRAA